MSNENPAAAATPERQPLIEPAPASQRRTNPWKVSTFVVGGAGVALAVLTGVAGLAIGSAADRPGGFGPGDRGGYTADGPGRGMNDSRHGGHHGDRGRDGDRDRGLANDGAGRGMDRPGMMEDNMPGMQGPQDEPGAGPAEPGESTSPQG